MDRHRRMFMSRGAAGLAVAAGTMMLPGWARATPSDGSALPAFFDAELGKEVKATEPNIEGPFFRRNAPFRGKVTPPLEPGVVMLLKGRVWGLDTRKPLPDALLDVWQANKDGRYDNDDAAKPPDPDVYVNRLRLRCDEKGRYEYETIHPGSYLNGTQYRPPHIHYRVQAVGYKTLITQLYFEGDKHQEKDPFIRKSLIIKLEQAKRGEVSYETGTFDVVLAKA